MGTIFAPSFANLYMGSWEQVSIYDRLHRLPIRLYKRYIDDILLIWEDTESQFENFIKALNINEFGLLFTAKFGGESIEYLDLQIQAPLTFEQKITTSTYLKNVDANGYLDYQSCHLSKWKQNIPYSQFLRLRRNCTDISKFDSMASELTSKFSQRNYPSSLITDSKNKARAVDRESLLKYKEPSLQLCSTNVICPFITDYSSMSKDIVDICKKHWPVLQMDPKLGPILPNLPKVIFRKAKNLKSYLSPSLLPSLVPNKEDHRPKGFFPCSSCKMCKFADKNRNTFKDSSNTKQFRIQSFMNCNTTHVIYLLECGCGLKYVGKTKRPFKIRALEHFRNILHGLKNHSVPRHFSLCHQSKPDTMKIKAIELVKLNERGGDRLTKLSQRETYWIYMLNTSVPFGLNESSDFSSFL